MDKIEAVQGGVMVAPDDITRLLICFAWALVDSQTPDLALTPHKFWHSSSYAYGWRYTFSISMYQLHSCFPDDYIGLKRKNASILIAFLKIYNDFFDYLWSQYCRIAKEQGGIHSFDGWQLLKAPEYFVLQKEDESGYLIYRYD